MAAANRASTPSALGGAHAPQPHRIAHHAELAWGLRRPCRRHLETRPIAPLATARPTSRRTAPSDSCSTAAPVTRTRIISGGSISAFVSSKYNDLSRSRFPDRPFSCGRSRLSGDAATQSARPDDMGADWGACLRISPVARHPSSVSEATLRRQSPGIGAACKKAARTVLSGLRLESAGQAGGNAMRLGRISGAAVTGVQFVA
jgi:hypothetical protein